MPWENSHNRQIYFIFNITDKMHLLLNIFMQPKYSPLSIQIFKKKERKRKSIPNKTDKPK